MGILQQVQRAQSPKTDPNRSKVGVCENVGPRPQPSDRCGSSKKNLLPQRPFHGLQRISPLLNETL